MGGLPQDLKQAAEWFQKAAAQGVASAQNNLGTFFEHGRGGLPKDLKQAFELFRKAAEQGHALSQNNLGRFFEESLELPQDLKQAAEWYQRAAEQDYSLPKNNLARFFAQGLGGLPQDLKQAAEWFHRAAGHQDACVTSLYNLGVFFENGLGVEQNAFRAHLLYQAAAEKNTTYFSNLDNLESSFPFNVYPALKYAITYYKKCRADNIQKSYMHNALSTLAFCYLMGLGIQQDLVEGQKLLIEAISKGCPGTLWDAVVLCRQPQLNFDKTPFYRILHSKTLPASLEIERKECLAYLYTHGAIGFPKDLSMAQVYSTVSSQASQNTSSPAKGISDHPMPLQKVEAMHINHQTTAPIKPLVFSNGPVRYHPFLKLPDPALELKKQSESSQIKLSETEIKLRQEFFYAVKVGNVNRIEELIRKQGCDIRWKDIGDGNPKSGILGGATVLHYACDRGHLELVHFLLRGGFKLDINEYDDRLWTPLMYAANKDDGNEHYDNVYPAIVRLLVQKGADILKPEGHRADNLGMTCLHIAACGQDEALKILLNALLKVDAEKAINGCDVKDRFGLTPLDYARGKKNEKLETQKKWPVCEKILISHQEAYRRNQEAYWKTRPWFNFEADPKKAEYHDVSKIRVR